MTTSDSCSRRVRAAAVVEFTPQCHVYAAVEVEDLDPEIPAGPKVG